MLSCLHACPQGSGGHAILSELPKIPGSDSSTEQYGSGTSGILDWYQNFISPAKGGNTCPMYPSCSQYAKIAFQQLDPVSAFMATCDRYVRCGRDRENYPQVFEKGELLAYDPVTRDDQSPPLSGALESSGTRTEPAHCGAFAARLLQQGDYLLAELEFQRVLLLSPERPCRMQAALGLLQSSYRIDNLDRFLDFFYRVSDSMGTDTGLLSRCGLLLAKRYLFAGRFGDVRGALANYVVSDSAPLHDERHLLEAVDLLSVRDRKGAMAEADSISATGDLHAFPAVLDRTDPGFCRFDRSPACAGLLSTLIPGAGYLYADRPGTAIASLLINGLFAWSSYDFFSHKLYGAGATSVLLGSGFYLGGIRGSLRAASKYNETSLKRRIARLLEDVHYVW